MSSGNISARITENSLIGKVITVGRIHHPHGTMRLLVAAEQGMEIVGLPVNSYNVRELEKKQIIHMEEWHLIGIEDAV